VMDKPEQIQKMVTFSNFGSSTKCGFFWSINKLL
jgi:hypothetical protein